MPPVDGPPVTHEGLLADLRTLRRNGLVRLRGVPLETLYAAAARCGVLGGSTEPAAIEELLRQAIGGLGGGDLAVAAEYTFGLAPGTRGWAIGERRRRAAQTYGVSVERFRKHHERLVVEQVAEEVIKLCATTAADAGPGGPVAPPDPDVLVRAGHTTLPLRLPLGGRERELTLHVKPVELLRDIDVLVSSENVSLEMSKMFKTTVSAALRRAGARRDAAGEIVDDTVQRELTEWLRRNGRVGYPVTAGTVAVTGPGALASEGIRRIYHAGVATPRPDSDDYSVSPDAVAIAVRNVLRLAGAERDRHTPPLSSICLPLFGAGHGGVPAVTSFRWLWAALDQELDEMAPWRLHVVTHSTEQAEEIVRAVMAGTGRSTPGSGRHE
jgi:O-acetyl-ADP-ribose deacetylase (regulator of RNase III)